MAILALHSAATGLSALSTQIDVIANNLANVNNDGFKGSRVNFEDLMYERRAQPGVENANGDVRPAGLFVGLGTRVSNTQFDFSTGSARLTGKDGDLMIDGRGLFQVSIPPDRGGDGIGYTRAGNFVKNADGDLVLGNAEGPRLEPPITIPDDAVSFDVASDGTVNVKLLGQTELQSVGQIELATFVNLSGLEPIGGNIFVPSTASGPAITGVPGEGGLGTINDKTLESSNIDPVRELVDLIKAQRAFEMNSQSIQAADESLQVISNLRRF